MDEDRRETLATLVELAEANDAISCFDSQRAESLLLSQSSREELEMLGIDSPVLDRLWPEKS